MALPTSYSSSLPIKIAAALITLVALALGGSTQLWEQATVFTLAGLLLVVLPPRRTAGWFLGLLAVLLALLAFAAFLPAAWFSESPWRAHLTGEMALHLPWTRTPQPWLTFQAAALLCGTLIWAIVLFSLAWRREERLLIGSILVGGVGLLAAVAIGAFLSGWRPPFWLQEQNRGWFPNRNQTGDVLGVSGIINYVLLIDRVSKGRRAGGLWLLSLAAIAIALVISTSRAGILIFFAGVVLWHAWPTQFTNLRQAWARLRWARPGLSTSGTMKWPMLGLALIFLLLTFFFLFGGTTVDRFKGFDTAGDSEAPLDYRVLIQHDALRFSFDSPLFGVGLGNFAPLFPSFREASVRQNRIIHPESDWLWAACELGWGAPLIFAAAIFWWLTRCLPFELQSGESLRRGFVVATLMCLLHGFIDVSGHRLGSVLVELLLASMAMRKFSSEKPWRAHRLIFRGWGLVLLLIAGWWFASVADEPGCPPTTEALARWKDDAGRASYRGDLPASEAYARTALSIAPLDWTSHFQCGNAEAFAGHLLPAIREFQTARLLYPYWVKLYSDEGYVWLSLNDPDRCLDAWKEALRHAGDYGLTLYDNFLNDSADQPLVREGLENFAAGRPDWQLVFLHRANPAELRRRIASLLADDPNLQKLTDVQRADLFATWWRIGEQADRDDLVQKLNDHPSWLAQGWLFAAQQKAAQNDFEGACALVLKYSPPPKLPAIPTQLSQSEMESDFYARPGDLGNGLALYQADMAQGHTDDALSVVRTMEKSSDAPAYLPYLEGTLWAKKSQWELAWGSWKKFYSLQ